MIRVTVLSAITAILLTGCGGTPSSGVVSPETKAKMQDAYDSLKKDQQKKLDEINKQLDGLKEKADKATGDAKTAMEKRYAELKVQRDKFADEVNKFGKASGDAWEKLKDGLIKASSEAGDAFKKAAEEFK